jgi:hypothetical protein
MRFVVIYVQPKDEGARLWQFFGCVADSDAHAEELCRKVYPTCRVIWVGGG